jgi:EAL domain-containing protein (putative c-di-GMP-specific phosphodiesterase class I)
MYDSKQSGRDAVRRYRAGSVDLTMRRLSLDAEVHAAIAGNQFLLEYQPIVDARTRNVVAAEALLRWNHPTKGLLEPSVFLDATNSRDFVNTLGEWVLNEACAQAARWRRDDGLYLRMAINVQPRHMQSDRAYIALLRRALVEHQLPAGAIELELTEKTIVRDMDWAIAILTEIRDLGFGIAIDDFGTGYNSLSYLKSFPVTTIKIDRSFVTEIGTDSFSEALSSAVAALGKARNLRVIAEGVETEEQCEKLVALGCDELQGFFFSPPISAEEFSARYCSATR